MTLYKLSGMALSVFCFALVMVYVYALAQMS
jgi:hypothetical protein